MKPFFFVFSLCPYWSYLYRYICLYMTVYPYTMSTIRYRRSPMCCPSSSCPFLCICAFYFYCVSTFLCFSHGVPLLHFSDFFPFLFFSVCPFHPPYLLASSSLSHFTFFLPTCRPNLPFLLLFIVSSCSSAGSSVRLKI